MTVGLGTLYPADEEFDTVDVYADSYDCRHLTMYDPRDGNIIIVDRAQLQELSIIIDRFLDD